MSEDRVITCVDCGEDFIWSVGEQEFFREKGFTDEPKRCKSCRQAKRLSQNDGDQMGGGNR